MLQSVKSSYELRSTIAGFIYLFTYLFKSSSANLTLRCKAPFWSTPKLGEIQSPRASRWMTAILAG